MVSHCRREERRVLAEVKGRRRVCVGGVCVSHGGSAPLPSPASLLCPNWTRHYAAMRYWW